MYASRCGRRRHVDMPVRYRGVLRNRSDKDRRQDKDETKRTIVLSIEDETEVEVSRSSHLFIVGTQL